MAKQEEPKKNVKVPSIKDKAKIVKEAPTGPEWEQIIENGDTIYKRKSASETPPVRSSSVKIGGVKPPISKKIGAPSKNDSVNRRRIPETSKKEEEYLRVVKDVPSPIKETNLYGDVSTFERLEPKQTPNQFYETRVYPNSIGNFTNDALKVNFIGDKEVTFDNNGNPIYTGKTVKDYRDKAIQQIEKPEFNAVDKTNNTSPVINFTQPGTKFTKNPLGGSGIIPSTTTDKFIPKKFDSSGVEIPLNNGLQPIETPEKTSREVGKMYDVPKLKNGGGIASKVKGYYNGGGVYNPNMNIDGTYGDSNSSYKPLDSYGGESGIINQNDKYSEEKSKEEKKAKDEAYRKGVNKVGDALGAYGSSYYSSKQSQSNGDAARSAAMSSVSQMGGVGGVIGGVAGIGDQIGAPIKADSEKMDSKGNIINKEKSKQNAVGGFLLSPSKALAYRSDSGNWTELSGNKYNEYLEKKAKDQLAEVEAVNTVSRQQQAVLSRNNQEENSFINNPYDTKGASFDENQNLILSNGQQFDKDRPMMNKGGIVSKIKGYSDGGQIKGKGTGKSDSILAKVEADSFVVPEENAEVAEEIREKYLGKPPKSKANLNQKGGEKVKLSNGEHLYTPEEKEELLEKGVNVDLLAPKSEVKAVEKKSHIMFPNVIGLKEGGSVPKGTKVDGVTWNGTNWIDASGNKYTAEKGKVFENKYNQSVNKAKSNEESRKASELNVYKRKYNEAVNAGDTKQAEGLNRKIKELQGVNKVTPNEVKSESDSSVIVPKKANIKPPKSNKIVVADNLPSKDIALTELKNDAELRANANAIDSENSIANAPIKQAALNDAANEGYVNPNSGKKKGSVLDKIGSIDPTSLIGIGQTALGLKMLGKSKRPVDNAVINSTYNDAVNRAQQDAKFGLTPEQKFAAEQDIQNGLNDSKFAGVNYSGGSGAQAFNTNRAAINDAWKNKLGLKQADFEMRMNKQKYADAMASDRATILASNRRQAFNDAMGAFNQNQQSGSELVGAGIQNAIGAYRFNKIKKQQDELDNERNIWGNA